MVVPSTLTTGARATKEGAEGKDPAERASSICTRAHMSIVWGWVALYAGLEVSHVVGMRLHEKMRDVRTHKNHGKTNVVSKRESLFS